MKNKNICNYCGEEILQGQLYEIDGDGDHIHMSCSAEIDDGNDLNNSMGDS